MKFKFSRDTVVSSTCGLSVRFDKNEFHLVPPSMYGEVIARGGVSEEELAEDEVPAPAATPESAAAREAAIFKAFKAVALRNDSTEFTAGGAPHVGVVSGLTGWPVQAKERDTAWLKFQQTATV